MREVLRYSSVEQVVMVDLDKQACELCKEHLPEWNQVRTVCVDLKDSLTCWGGC